MSFFTAAQMEAKLRQVGFTSVEFLTPQQVAAYYSHCKTLPPPSHTGIVAAAL